MRGVSRRREATAAAVKPQLDEATASALTLFNTYLIADREQQAHERAVRQAEKAKDEAAAKVRKLHERKASGADTAAAEAAYREALDTLRRLRDGETPAAGRADKSDEGAEATEAAADDA